jgi:hypothetical protein
MNSTSVFVELTREEMQRAANVAKELHDRLRRRGIKDGHGLKAGNHADMEAGGAQSELAVANYYGVQWTSSLPGHTAMSPDIGSRTQVRSSYIPRASHHLQIRPKDIEKYGNVPYVLVIQNQNRFEIKGWIMAFDGLKVARVYDGNGRPPVYQIHESKLLPPDTLTKEQI